MAIFAIFLGVLCLQSPSMARIYPFWVGGYPPFSPEKKWEKSKSLYDKEVGPCQKCFIFGTVFISYLIKNEIGRDLKKFCWPDSIFLK